MSDTKSQESVLVVDFGAQYAQLIARRVRQAQVYSEIVPSSMAISKMLEKKPTAIILSGGPSSVYEAGAPTLDPKIFEAGIPIFGICFGHQILGRALGFETYKLTFGHRGINQPVIDKNTGTVEITSHNHGFALKAPTDTEFSTVYGTGEVTHVSIESFSKLICNLRWLFRTISASSSLA